MDNLRILKLKSGEDIICGIYKDLKHKYLVANPFDMETMTLVDAMGIPRKEKLVLKKWINFCKGDKITIPKDHVVGVLSPTQDLVEAYLVAKQRTAGIGKLTESEMEEIQDEMNQAQQMLGQIMDGIMSGKIDPESIEDMVEDEMDELFEEMPLDDTIEGGVDWDDDQGTNYGSHPDHWSPDPEDYT